jgi:hypothetical protein
MSNQAPPTILLVAFPIVFVGMWLFIAVLLSEVRGWSRLAREFPGGPRPAGRRLYRQVMGMGLVGENGVTTLIPTSEGLYLYSNFLFRFRRPPVFVPWRDIRNDGERGMRWWRNVVLELGGVTTLRIRAKAFPILEPYLAQRRNEPAA